MRKLKIGVITYLLVFVPFLVFFCYNLGKYENFLDSIRETFNVYIFIFPLLLMATYLSIRYLKKENKS